MSGRWGCPSCDAVGFESVGRLAAHLAESHGLGSSEALKRAREVSEDKILGKGAVMATGRKCGGCGEVGHRADKCPKASSKPVKAKKPTATNGNGYDAVLDDLRARRDQFDAAITAIEALE